LGRSGGYTYNVIGSANHPITYVNWYDAARFTNWLYNGQPTTGGEGNETTETGSYMLNGFNPNNVTRNANATWVIPTENEWYKAAYYNPASNSYFQYPFSSSTVPTSAPPGGAPNTGNFYADGTGFAVTPGYSPTQNYLTNVGAYASSASPYGAFDMGGDVFQWNESPVGTGRGNRGGAWYYDSDTLASSYQGNNSPGVADQFIGFRVAYIPQTLLGDYNNDGHVNAADISALELALTNLALYESTFGVSDADLQQFNQLPGESTTNLNNSDLQALENYLKSGGGSNNSVPEPSTLVLAVLCFLSLHAYDSQRRGCARIA
jgi:hypothetical protein